MAGDRERKGAGILQLRKTEFHGGDVPWCGEMGKNPESVAVDSLSLQVIDCYKRQILHLETIILGTVHDRVGFSASAYI